MSASYYNDPKYTISFCQDLPLNFVENEDGSYSTYEAAYYKSLTKLTECLQRHPTEPNSEFIGTLANIEILVATYVK